MSTGLEFNNVVCIAYRGEDGGIRFGALSSAKLVMRDGESSVDEKRTASTSSVKSATNPAVLTPRAAQPKKQSHAPPKIESKPQEKRVKVRDCQEVPPKISRVEMDEIKKFEKRLEEDAKSSMNSGKIKPAFSEEWLQSLRRRIRRTTER